MKNGLLFVSVLCLVNLLHAAEKESNEVVVYELSFEVELSFRKKVKNNFRTAQMYCRNQQEHQQEQTNKMAEYCIQLHNKFERVYLGTLSSADEFAQERNKAIAFIENALKDEVSGRLYQQALKKNSKEAWANWHISAGDFLRNYLRNKSKVQFSYPEGDAAKENKMFFELNKSVGKDDLIIFTQVAFAIAQLKQMYNTRIDNLSANPN